MQATRIHEDGGPEVLGYEDVPDPEPAEGQVLVRLVAASCNHLGVWVRMSLPSGRKPRILGADGPERESVRSGSERLDDAGASSRPSERHVGAIARRRRRVGVGDATTGPNPPAALHRLWWKQLTVYGSIGARDDFDGVYDLVRSGRARLHVDSVFPLTETRAAHERLEASAQLGTIALSSP